MCRSRGWRRRFDADAFGTARIRSLETRVAVDEARIRALDSDVTPFRHLRLMGYTQVQYTFQSKPK